MKNKILIGFAIFLIQTAASAVVTTGLDWAFFKNYISPAWVWGNNGLITIPIAETLGKGHVALSFNGIDSGKIQNEQLVFSTASVQIGTSADVEIGYTKKYLLYKWMTTNVEGEVLHLKVKLLDVSESLPKVAIGTVAFSLTNKDNYSTKDMFFDVFAVLSQNISIARLHLGYEFGMIGAATSKGFFFAGTDIPIGPITLMAEYIGSDKDGQGGTSNAGLSLKPFGDNFILSAAMTNLGQPAGSKLMLQSSLVF